MKVSVRSLVLLFALSTSAAAFADHTLWDAMDRSLKLRIEVELTMQENNVICNVENSTQTYYYSEEIGSPDGGTAWKQIALCYTQQSVDEHFNPKFEDKYLIGVLVVAYTWVDYAPGELLTISYQ